MSCDFINPIYLFVNFIELDQNVPYGVNSNLEVKHNDIGIFIFFIAYCHSKLVEIIK